MQPTLGPLGARQSVKSRISQQSQISHETDDSWNPDADFGDNSRLDVAGSVNHGFGASVQIHESIDLSQSMEEEEEDDDEEASNFMTPDALPVESLPSHYLSDSVESLDPDFVLEPAYFENYDYAASTRDSSASSTVPPLGDPVSVPIDDPLYGKQNTLSIHYLQNSAYSAQSRVSDASTVLSGRSSLNSVSTEHTMGISADMDYGGSTQWTMPGVSLDHTASVQLLQSMQMFKPNTSAMPTISSSAATNTNNDSNQAQKPPISRPAMPKSVQFEAPMTNPKSVQFDAIPMNPKSVQFEGPPTMPKSVQFEAIPSASGVTSSSSKFTNPKSVQFEGPPVADGKSVQLSGPKSIQFEAANKPMNIGQSVQYQKVNMPTGNKSMAASLAATGNNGVSMNMKSQQITSGASIGGDQFVMWQIHGRKLQKMKHEELIKWLENSGFDEETLAHFRKSKIDGRRLWANIRNASMFLYNVGVVRPTLRDAIVQNIYLELLPKTPGFDERHMSDFKRLELIADGPISTVYKAVIQKEKLKLRESTVVIKGYHFSADDVRVGKIIQILVHMVTNISSQRFVKIHGFIRNMMETDKDNESSNGDEEKNSYKHRAQRPMFGIVMEYCDDGSLASMYRDSKQYNIKYNIMDKIGFIIEVATAMSELHKMNTLHRNLKASNVLISNNDDVKLTDYCLDVTTLTDFNLVEAKERSIRWMAPELIQTQNHTKLCDIYSFGITMYEILSGNKPYYEYTQIPDLLRRILTENLRPNIDDLANLPEELLVLMSNCWSENPQARPSDFDDIIDELDAIKETLRKSCITFDDMYAQARASFMAQRDADSTDKKRKLFQSSPLLTMNDSDEDLNEYTLFDEDEEEEEEEKEEDNDDRDDEKFQSLLQPTKHNRAMHSKDDTALEMDKIRNFQPKRRKIHAKKKRPRKPLPKAPPVKKALPQIDGGLAQIEIKPNVTKQVHMPDKPLPPKPLHDI